jgi:hypothetical protein
MQEIVREIVGVSSTSGIENGKNDKMIKRNRKLNGAVCDFLEMIRVKESTTHTD